MLDKRWRAPLGGDRGDVGEGYAGRGWRQWRTRQQARKHVKRCDELSLPLRRRPAAHRRQQTAPGRTASPWHQIWRWLASTATAGGATRPFCVGAAWGRNRELGDGVLQVIAGAREVAQGNRQCRTGARRSAQRSRRCRQAQKWHIRVARVGAKKFHVWESAGFSPMGPGEIDPAPAHRATAARRPRR
jgi:hypothetical protein